MILWPYIHRLNTRPPLHNLLQAAAVVIQSANTHLIGQGTSRQGAWQQLDRIDWLRGTVKDDKANAWWAHLYDTVPVLRQLGTANVTSTNTKGNAVEACVGASFLASHELLNRRFQFRTEPPEALKAAAEMFTRFAACDVSTPPLIPRKDYFGIPALLEGLVLNAVLPRHARSPRLTFTST